MSARNTTTVCPQNLTVCVRERERVSERVSVCPTGREPETEPFDFFPSPLSLSRSLSFNHSRLTFVDCFWWFIGCMLLFKNVTCHDLSNITCTCLDGIRIKFIPILIISANRRLKSNLNHLDHRLNLFLTSNWHHHHHLHQSHHLSYLQHLQAHST